MGFLLLAALGGALVVYGLVQRGKKERADPLNSNVILGNVEVPDSVARTDGNLALVIGIIFLLSAFFL